ncbi:MAG: hypothetical protein ACKO34_08130 [Vampirovibrionales bacterium]
MLAFSQHPTPSSSSLPSPHQPLNQHRLYQRTLLSAEEVATFHLDNFWTFVGVDIAPNASLETGLVMIDNELTITRMDKLYTNAAIQQTLTQIAGQANVMVVLDMPKNLSVPGRFRQEELKYHGLRLHEAGYDRQAMSRFNRRARQFYTQLEEQGLFPVLGFASKLKMNLGFTSAFKARSPQGCRNLQSFVSDVLQLKNMPINLIPSSVLDAMVLAYAGWVLSHGDYGVDAMLYHDAEGYRVLDVKHLLELEFSPVRPDWVPC